MKIVVCVKQVPDTKGGVKFNPDGTLDRSAMLAIMNPDDKAGLEAALRLKDQYGAEEIFDFIHDFRVVKVSDRKYINLTRSSSFIKNLAEQTSLPLTSYFLSNSDIKKVLSHRF